ncbi:MAG: branched-chain amino acid ABC transporter permease [Oscillospiraceae bacterium]
MKTKKQIVKQSLTYILLAAAFIIVWAMIKAGAISRHMSSMLVPICINVILAVSLNLVIGFLGELSLGHAGFMSVGAYVGCLFSIYTEEIIPTIIRFPLAMLFGGGAAAIFGLIVGVPVLRLKGDYLAIVTLAFGEIIRSIIINLEFTGGASGLKGTPQNSNFTIAFVVLVITVFLITNLTDSKHGRAIRSLKENMIAASACGVNINNYKLMAFIISAFFAGVAGVIFGHNLSILSAATFDYNKSIEILVMVVLGGIGSIPGSIISATALTVLPESLRVLKDYRMLIYSLVLIAVMILNSNESFKEFKRNLSFKKLITVGRKETK